MTKPLPSKSLVWYAEDDPDDLQLVTDAFQDYAETVELLTFPDGISLLDFAEKRHRFQQLPCLIILDINMPRMNGKETLRSLRQTDELADVPVVLFSTSSQPAEVKFAREFNAGFITKPLDTAQMMQVIDQFIDHCGEEIRKLIRRNKRQ